LVDFGMDIKLDDLLPSEELIQSKMANSMIKVDEAGLSRLAFDQLNWLVGMKGKEAIGGKLHLTNYRIVFRSHPLNRVKGKFSILLPTVQDVQDASNILIKKMKVITPHQEFDFVVWGIQAMIPMIKAQQELLTPDQVDSLKRYVVSEYEKLGEGLQVVQAMEAINIAALTAVTVARVATTAQNPLELTTVLNVFDLLQER
jgi:hypothetical protein